MCSIQYVKNIDNIYVLQVFEIRLKEGLQNWSQCIESHLAHSLLNKYLTFVAWDFHCYVKQLFLRYEIMPGYIHDEVEVFKVLFFV